MANPKIISASVSTERGRVLIQAAKTAGLPHTAVTPDRPYTSYEGRTLAVKPGTTWVIVETGTKQGSDRFFAEVDKIETSNK